MLAAQKPLKLIKTPLVNPLVFTMRLVCTLSIVTLEPTKSAQGHLQVSHAREDCKQQECFKPFQADQLTGAPERIYYTATENINIHRVFGSARNSRICINKRLRPPCTY